MTAMCASRRGAHLPRGPLNPSSLHCGRIHHDQTCLSHGCVLESQQRGHGGIRHFPSVVRRGWRFPAAGCLFLFSYSDSVRLLHDRCCGDSDDPSESPGLVAWCLWPRGRRSSLIGLIPHPPRRPGASHITRVWLCSPSHQVLEECQVHALKRPIIRTGGQPGN